MKVIRKKNNIARAIAKKKNNIAAKKKKAKKLKTIKSSEYELVEDIDDEKNSGIDCNCFALILALNIALVAGGAYLYLTKDKCPENDKVQSDVSPESEMFTTTIADFTPTTNFNLGETPPAIPNISTIPTTTLALAVTTTTVDIKTMATTTRDQPPKTTNTNDPGLGPDASTTIRTTTTVHHTEFKCGTPSDSGSGIKWPWYIRLTKRRNPGANDFVRMCSATIVSPLNALTARTCFNGMSKVEIIEDVRGAFKEDFALKNVESYYKVIKVRHHPLGRTLPLLVRDLTLLIFGERSLTDYRMTPVCLPSMTQRIDRKFEGKECFALLWDSSARNQQKCLIVFADPQRCKDNFKDSTLVEEATFCVEYGRGGTGCFRMIETGSPVVCKENNLWYLYGIRSKELPALTTHHQLAMFAEVAYATDWLCCLFPGVWPCSKFSAFDFESSHIMAKTIQRSPRRPIPREKGHQSLLSFVLPTEKICSFPKIVDDEGVFYSSVMEVNAEPWSIRLHMKKPWSTDVFEISKCEATIVSPKYAVTSGSCLSGKTNVWIKANLAGTTRHHVEDRNKNIIRIVAAQHKPRMPMAFMVLDDFSVLIFENQIPASDLTSEVYLSNEDKMSTAERCFVAFSNRPANTQIYCPVFFASVAACRKQFPKQMRVVGSSFCVKSSETKENNICFCKVLRGSPMVCEKNNLWYLRGVTSLKHGCKEKNLLLLSDVQNNVYWLCCILRVQNCKNVVCNVG